MDDSTFQYVEKLNPEMQRYMNCMTDIKRRWDYIDKRLKSSGFAKTQPNIESTCLQFRMIIELIFLANLSSHEGYYGKLLFELAGMWKIHEIIAEIEKVNPYYYPEVIRVTKKKIPERPEADGEIHFLPNPLPKEDILKIYSQCCDFLHPLNPFEKERDYAEVFNKFKGWLDKIKRLLAKHSVQLVERDLKIFCFINFDAIGVPNEIQVGFTHKVP